MAVEILQKDLAQTNQGQQAKAAPKSLLDQIVTKTTEVSKKAVAAVNERESAPKSNAPFIIIVPSSASSLISLYNAQKFFGEEK